MEVTEQITKRERLEALCRAIENDRTVPLAGRQALAFWLRWYAERKAPKGSR